MAETLDQAWEWLLDCARGHDASCADRSKTWPAPIMTPLALAAATTRLRRFYPFIGHELLCFATSPVWYQGEGAVAPAFIGVAADPDRYIVWSGHPSCREPVAEILQTTDPLAAATELDRLLTDWRKG
ncbi:hypothetical protein ACFFWC_04210 [Plantactinospora siamensis]|uniref:DUF5753 domain-containing protein n=1 Tax=Plantactinospora siamensis TaxID=555372 RepID=A0ABV6NSX4_9ACTN